MAQALHPTDEGLLHRAMTLQQQRRTGEADAICRSLLQRHPWDHQVLYVAGVTAIAAGNPRRGAELLARAIRIRPAFAPAHLNRGVALAALGRAAEALACHDRALALDPGLADAHYNRGVALEASGRPDDAAVAYEAALAVQPHIPEALNNLGNLLNRRGDHAMALSRLDAAVALRPDFAAAHSNRGNALLGLDRPKDALDGFDRALSHQPDLPEAWCNRGEALAELGRPQQAAASFRRALSLRPDFAEAEFGLSLVTLALGDYQEGFRLQEARWRRPGAAPRRGAPQRLWLGQGTLAGKRLLIEPELHLGDMIQFCRYALLARDHGAAVLLRTPPPLLALMGTLGQGISVSSTDASPLASDLYCPLMSLPHAFGTTLRTVPADIPYLHAEVARVAHWRSVIGGHGLRIGVCWQGSEQRRTLRRGFPVTMLRHIAGLPGIRLISLQTGAGAEQACQVPEIETYRTEPDAGGLRPFTETAAMMMALDLVITPDTSIAHLAGALARPVWVALKMMADWRWGLQEPCTPWYHTTRLFRQRQPDDWAPVFAAMREALAA